MTNHRLYKQDGAGIGFHTKESHFLEPMENSTSQESTLLIEIALTFMGDRIQRTGLDPELHNLILILQDEGYHFYEILEALSRYAKEESSKIASEEKSWERVSYLLKEAAKKAKAQEIALNKIALRLLQVPTRENGYLLYLMRRLVSLLVDKNYHVSDILLSLSEYSLQESVKNTEVRSSLGAVASLLKFAAQEAQTKGRELP